MIGARTRVRLPVTRPHCPPPAHPTPAPTPDGSGADPRGVRVVRNDPPQRQACLGDVVTLALEEALGSGTVRGALAAPEPPRPTWSTAAIRALFPRLGVRIGEEVEIGHALLARGEV